MIDATCRERTDMAILTVDDLLTATGGDLVCGEAKIMSGVCIDSRKAREGELFVALKGERFDGHDFLREALEKAAGAVVHLPGVAPVPGKTIIRVPNTLGALQDIARFLRHRRDIPVVAVTGSNGKTTTKELIAAVLGSEYQVLKNMGNLNNQIGLPLSIAQMSEEDQVIVLEMGASTPGDIRELCGIAAPEYGVITNIGRAHLEGFGDIETVRRTKLEILETARVAVVNGDDLFLMDGIRRSGFRGSVIRFGIESPADVRATDIVLGERGADFRIEFGDRPSVSVQTRTAGLFNIYNVLAAASLGYLFDIDSANLQRAISSFTGVPMRMEFREIGGVMIISDAYNANPASVEAALRELVRIRKGRSIAVLGDMLELGSYEEEAHRQVGRFVSALGIDIFIAVGPRMALASSECHGETYRTNTPEEAGRLLRSLWQPGDTVLIKGSRGIHMERTLEE